MRHFSTALVLFAMVATFAFTATPSMAAGHPVATTAAVAKASGVDTDVCLDGQVVKVNGDKFLFNDGTGELLVYIDDPEMQRIAASGHAVKIKGNIVQNFMYTEVKADSVSQSD